MWYYDFGSPPPAIISIYSRFPRKVLHSLLVFIAVLTVATAVGSGDKESKFFAAFFHAVVTTKWRKKDKREVGPRSDSFHSQPPDASFRNKRICVIPERAMLYLRKEKEFWRGFPAPVDQLTLS